MTPPPRTPTRGPTGGQETPSPDALEEVTDERTIECDLESMAEDLGEDGPQTPGIMPQGVVAGAIEDDSAGARTPPERAARRARRATVSSPVPSLLAKSMKPVNVVRTTARIVGRIPAAARVPAGVRLPAPTPARESAPARDPAAPAIHGNEDTRRVGETDHAAPAEHISSGYSVEVIPLESEAAHAPHAPQRSRTPHAAPHPVPAFSSVPASVATLVDRACTYMKHGDVAQAVVTADEAITANDHRREIDAAHLEDIAAGPLARIFTAGGALNRLPTVARAPHELDLLVLDELHWALLRRIDGQKTIDQVFAATKIPAINALRIAAALLRAGVIRIDERPHG